MAQARAAAIRELMSHSDRDAAVQHTLSVETPITLSGIEVVRR